MDQDLVTNYQRATILIKFLQVLSGLVSVFYAIYLFANVKSLKTELKAKLSGGDGSFESLTDTAQHEVTDGLFYFEYI